MRVLSTTLCYPTPSAPMQGVFVQRRLAEIARRVSVSVIVPIPLFPGRGGLTFNPADGRRMSPPVTYCRMFYLPGIIKRLDAAFYERALLSAIDDAGGRDSFDLIDAHFEWPDGVGAFRAARRLGLPFVCTLRGKLVSRMKHRAMRRAMARMLCNADAVISVSQSLADLARQVANRDRPIHVIPNGIDGKVFHRIDDGRPPTEPSASARNALGWSPDAKYVVSVGHLQELKGWHRLVRIWPEVRRRAGDARLVLVGGSAGEPAYERRLRRMIASTRPADTVEAAGRVDQMQIARLLNGADLFVLASRSEGWCNALAEALACGCPAVATDVGGNREVMNDWNLGRLVPPDDDSLLAQRISEALTTPWNRSHIAAFGGRRDWQQTADQCVDVFKRAAFCR